jgi:hypothetical protein
MRQTYISTRTNAQMAHGDTATRRAATHGMSILPAVKSTCIMRSYPFFCPSGLSSCALRGERYASAATSLVQTHETNLVNGLLRLSPGEEENEGEGDETAWELLATNQSARRKVECFDAYLILPPDSEAGSARYFPSQITPSHCSESISPGAPLPH